MNTPKHSVSVAGIVVSGENKILTVQRRDNGHWEPPGGVLELGETFEEGVLREVFEETGMHVRVVNLSGIYKNMIQGIVALVFRCEVAGGEPTLTAESGRVEWCTLGELESRMSPAYFVRVEDAFSPEVAFRAHDGVDLIEDGGRA